MKFICIVLSVIVLWATGMPCKDVASEFAKEKTMVVLKKNCSTSHEESDACSPFCICACCSSPFVSFSEIITVHPIKLIQAAYATHIPGKVLTGRQAIWQPPRLA